EVDLRAAELLRQAPGMEDRAWPANVVAEQAGQFPLEVLALADFLIGGVDVVHGLLEVRRHQLTTVGAEKAAGVGHGGEARIMGHASGPCCVVVRDGQSIGGIAPPALRRISPPAVSGLRWPGAAGRR